MTLRENGLQSRRQRSCDALRVNARELREKTSQPSLSVPKNSAIREKITRDISARYRLQYAQFVHAAREFVLAAPLVAFTDETSAASHCWIAVFEELSTP